LRRSGPARGLRLGPGDHRRSQPPSEPAPGLQVCTEQNIYVTLLAKEETRVSTAYEKYRAQRLADPVFRALYEQKRSEIELIDGILSHIEQRRAELGLSKADLARLVGARPESVRRLLAARSANPTLFTVTRLASVLGMQIDIKTVVPAEQLGPKIKKAAKELAAATA